MKTDRHRQSVQARMARSSPYRATYQKSLQQIDMAMLVREMRDAADLTQSQLAKEIGTTQSVIARLEDAEYTGHSLTMLERVASACGVTLKLRAEKKAVLDREVALV